jgi:hypothetical protein
MSKRWSIGVLGMFSQGTVRQSDSSRKVVLRRDMESKHYKALVTNLKKHIDRSM